MLPSLFVPEPEAKVSEAEVQQEEKFNTKTEPTEVLVKRCGIKSEQYASLEKSVPFNLQKDLRPTLQHLAAGTFPEDCWSTYEQGRCGKCGGDSPKENHVTFCSKCENELFGPTVKYIRTEIPQLQQTYNTVASELESGTLTIEAAHKFLYNEAVPILEKMTLSAEKAIAAEARTLLTCVTVYKKRFNPMIPMLEMMITCVGAVVVRFTSFVANFNFSVFQFNFHKNDASREALLAVPPGLIAAAILLLCAYLIYEGRRTNDKRLELAGAGGIVGGAGAFFFAAPVVVAGTATIAVPVAIAAAGCAALGYFVGALVG